MPVDRTVVGQKIQHAKGERARQFRREMTPAEQRLWQCLRGNRLEGFHLRRQQIIDGFIVDFYCHAAAVVVEVDGSVHQAHVEYDRERDRLLSARGFRTIRVLNDELEQDLLGVLKRIALVCREETQRSILPADRSKDLA